MPRAPRASFSSLGGVAAACSNATVNRNPIQQVLDADAQAQSALDAARRESSAALAQARAQARGVVERNERRTQQALTRFETARAAALEVEVAAIRAQAEARMAAQAAAAAAAIDAAVERHFHAFWPRAGAVADDEPSP